MEKVRTYNLSVFPYSMDSEEPGGNPTTIFLDADGLDDSEMKALAKDRGHECGFILSGRSGWQDDCHITMRYWVPNHEMEMCGHATVGAVWLLDQLGLLPSVKEIAISTRSGKVEAVILKEPDNSASQVLVSQPAGSCEDLSDDHIEDILSCLRITTAELATLLKVQNARTSRTKTLIPLKTREILNSLSPDFDRVNKVCQMIGSTGLYPYAIAQDDHQVFEARQFPRSSGYTEDPATGIAAAALAFSLLKQNAMSLDVQNPIHIRQGWSMGKPSDIQVLFRKSQGDINGCWISGNVKWVR
ncbi:PhzF family phenazine biosynthesis protein [Mariannaea sp. PMI_226]|nr:PhzF family phenazine biosynthesis protein [Mariannaea sp. PMI_226]